MVRSLDALRVISDPLRLRLVAALWERSRTVKELSTIVHIAPTKLYYHVDLLERHGFIKVDSTRIVSGITEKRYRAASRDIRVDRKLLAAEHPEEMLDGLLAAVLDATRTEAERSARNGTMLLDADSSSPRAALLSRAQVRLTPQQAVALRAQLDELVARAQTNDPQGEEAAQYDLTVAFFPISQGE